MSDAAVTTELLNYLEVLADDPCDCTPAGLEYFARAYCAAEVFEILRELECLELTTAQWVYVHSLLMAIENRLSAIGI